MTLTQSGPTLTAARRVHVLVSWASRARGKPQAGQLDWAWGEVDPQIKIKAVAVRNGNGCQIVKQHMSKAKEGDYFIVSTLLNINMSKIQGSSRTQSTLSRF